MAVSGSVLGTRKNYFGRSAQMEMELYLLGMGILLVSLMFNDLTWTFIGSVLVLVACFFDKNGELS